LNISIIVVAIQNKEFIFTKEFLGLMSEYNMNLTESIKGMISEEIAYTNVTMKIRRHNEVHKK